MSEAVARRGIFRGTEILHFKARTTMDNSGVEPSASGTIGAKQNQQGNANNQQLTISLSNLQSNTTYLLLASLRTDTNFAVVAEFEADANGDALIKYVRTNNGNASPGGDLLPDELNPLSNILALEVADASTQTVLAADFAAPDQFQYLIKRRLMNDHVDLDAEGVLRIKATQSFVQFRLRAVGLETNATYFLSVNDDIVTDRLTDATGFVEFRGLPPGVPDVLDISSIAVLDPGSNSVLSTTLP